MKRLLLFLLAVVLAGVSAMAEDWPIKIMGIQVTSDNASSIYEIGGETVFRAEKKSGSEYWIYIRQPEGVDQIVYEDTKEPMITFTADVSHVYICAENNVVLNAEKNGCFGVDMSIYPWPTVKNLHFTSLHVYDRLTLKSSYISPLSFQINEMYVRDVILEMPGHELKGMSSLSSLFVEDFGYISAASIEHFKSIMVQGSAVTNAHSFSDTDDGYEVSARDKDGKVIKNGVYVGLRKFPFWILNVQVTDLNKGNISGSGISALDPEKTRYLGYNSDEGRLTLENIKLESTDPFSTGILYEDPEGSLQVYVGEKSSISVVSCGIQSDGAIELMAESQLYVEGENGIICNNDLSMSGTLHVKGVTSAIQGSGGNLVMSNLRSLKAEAGDVVISGFGNVDEPTPLTYSVSNARFTDGDDGYDYAARDEKGEAITAATVTVGESMHMTIGSHQLNSVDFDFNGGIITGDGITGTVRVVIDEDNYNIYMNDATIEALSDGSPYGICLPYTDEWTVATTTNLYLQGNNIVKAKKNGVYNKEDRVPIDIYVYDGRESESDDEPTLTIESGEDGIDMGSNADLYFFENIHLTVDAERFAIYGSDNSKECSTSVAFYSSARLRGKEGTFVGIMALSYGKGMGIASPQRAVLDNIGDKEFYYLAIDGEIVTDWVDIRPLYFTLGDLNVSELNVDAQPYIGSGSGYATFNRETGLMTLNNFSISEDETHQIYIYTNEVTELRLVGENTPNYLNLANNSIYVNGSAGQLNNTMIYVESGCYAQLNRCKMNGCGLSSGGTVNVQDCILTNNEWEIFNESGSEMTFTSSTIDSNSSIIDYGIENYGNISISSNSMMSLHGNIYGYLGHSGSTLSIFDSKVSLCGDYEASAIGYGLNLYGDMELTTEDAFLYKSDDYFEVRNNDDQYNRDWVTFTVPADKKKYNLSVGGVDVTGLNCSDIKGGNISGKVSYDPVARRLTLTDATIGEGGVMLGYDIGATEVVLEGNNTITGFDPMGASFNSMCQANITSTDGKGSLTISNDDDWGTGLMLGAGGNISNCVIDVTCKHNAINGQATLTITGGYVTAEGGEASISGFSNLLLGDDTQITSPEGAYYNNEGWPCQLEVGGSVVTKQVVIRYLKNYGIKVGSMWITSDNYMAIKPAELKEGKVSFDPEKSELLLSCIRLEDKGIDVMDTFDPLTIVLEGENTIIGAGKPLNLMSKTDIKAKTSILSDSLIILTDLYGISFQNDLTFSDVYLSISAERAAFLGTGSAKLTLERSSMEATGWDEGVMTGVGDFILGERIKYVSPKDAAFDKETGTLVSGGELLKQVTVKWFMPGDANNDYLVDISDVRAIANNIWEVEQPWFVAYNADMNVDGEVNVTDIVYVVDMILDKPATARGKTSAALARRAAETSADRLSLACRNGLLTAALTNAEGYYGLQMDLRLSPGQTLSDIALCGSCADSHVVAWKPTDENNVYRVVIYALQPAALIGGDNQMLTLVVEGEGTVEADNILAVATDGKRCLLAPVSGSVVTSINNAKQNGEGEMVTDIWYSLDGRKLDQAPKAKGIYIRNGKKFIVK